MAERAASPRRSLTTRLGSYLLRHAQTLVGSLGRLVDQPFATFMTAAVIGIALALPAALNLLVVNGRALAGRLDTGTDISVFLRQEVGLDAARRVAARVEGRSDVAEVTLVTADEALQRFRDDAGFGAAVEALDENPLPHALVVEPAPGHSTAEAIAGLAAAMRAMPEADVVQDDLQWVRRLDAILEIIRRAVLLASALLSIAVIVVVGNTIRLDIQSRRDEIIIIKLIGGTDAFVRRPFLYTGLWYGLAGALLALAVLSAAVFLLRGPIERVAILYNSDFSLIGLGPALAAWLLGAGCLLGWVGSWIAAARHLRAVEPS
jgi:cell division transport system permease protein